MTMSMLQRMMVEILFVLLIPTIIHTIPSSTTSTHGGNPRIMTMMVEGFPIVDCCGVHHHHSVSSSLSSSSSSLLLSMAGLSSRSIILQQEQRHSPRRQQQRGKLPVSLLSSSTIMLAMSSSSSSSMSSSSSSFHHFNHTSTGGGSDHQAFDLLLLRNENRLYYNDTDSVTGIGSSSSSSSSSGLYLDPNNLDDYYYFLSFKKIPTSATTATTGEGKEEFEKQYQQMMRNSNTFLSTLEEEGPQADVMHPVVDESTNKNNENIMMLVPETIDSTTTSDSSSNHNLWGQKQVESIKNGMEASFQPKWTDLLQVVDSGTTSSNDTTTATTTMLQTTNSWQTIISKRDVNYAVLSTTVNSKSIRKNKRMVIVSSQLLDPKQPIIRRKRRQSQQKQHQMLTDTTTTLLEEIRINTPPIQEPSIIHTSEPMDGIQQDENGTTMTDWWTDVRGSLAHHFGIDHHDDDIVDSTMIIRRSKQFQAKLIEADQIRSAHQAVQASRDQSKAERYAEAQLSIISLEVQRGVSSNEIGGAMIAGFVSTAFLLGNTDPIGNTVLSSMVALLSITRGSIGETTRQVGRFYWSLLSSLYRLYQESDLFHLSTLSSTLQVVWTMTLNTMIVPIKNTYQTYQEWDQERIYTAVMKRKEQQQRHLFKTRIDMEYTHQQDVRIAKEKQRQQEEYWAMKHQQEMGRLEKIRSYNELHWIEHERKSIQQRQYDQIWMKRRQSLMEYRIMMEAKNRIQQQQQKEEKTRRSLLQQRLDINLQHIEVQKKQLAEIKRKLEEEQRIEEERRIMATIRHAEHLAMAHLQEGMILRKRIMTIKQNPSPAAVRSAEVAYQPSNITSSSSSTSTHMNVNATKHIMLTKKAVTSTATVHTTLPNNIKSRKVASSTNDEAVVADTIIDHTLVLSSQSADIMSFTYKSTTSSSGTSMTTSSTAGTVPFRTLNSTTATQRLAVLMLFFFFGDGDHKEPLVKRMIRQAAIQSKKSW